MVSERRRRLIAGWQGKNTFLFGGHCMLGPDTRALGLTFFVINAGVVTFFATVGPALASWQSWAFQAVTCLVYVVNMASLVATAGKDPGVVPRMLNPADPATAAGGAAAMTREYRVNGRIVKTKYCLTCSTYRSPRCSHCRVCDNCVERFDHHCPWVGTCIGKRNYRFFIAFILSSTFLCIWVVACSVWLIVIEIRDGDLSFKDAIRENPAAVALAIYAFIPLWFVGGLSLFHSFLILNNRTTYEHFRSISGSPVNPYDLGASQNCREGICFSSPSLLDNPQTGVYEVVVHRDNPTADIETGEQVADEDETKKTSLIAVQRKQEQRVSQAGPKDMFSPSVSRVSSTSADRSRGGLLSSVADPVSSRGKQIESECK